MTSVAAARHAPVEPAEKKPCAAPSRTARHPATMDEVLLLPHGARRVLAHADDLLGGLRRAAFVRLGEGDDHA